MPGVREAEGESGLELCLEASDRGWRGREVVRTVPALHWAHCSPSPLIHLASPQCREVVLILSTLSRLREVTLLSQGHTQVSGRVGFGCSYAHD